MAGTVATVLELQPVAAGAWFASGLSRWRSVCRDGDSRWLGPPRSRAGDVRLLLAGSAVERRAESDTGIEPQRNAAVSLSVPVACDDLPDSLLRGRSVGQKAGCADGLAEASQHGEHALLDLPANRRPTRGGCDDHRSVNHCTRDEVACGIDVGNSHLTRRDGSAEDPAQEPNAVLEIEL